MAQTYPGFDSAEQHDEYVKALETELTFLENRKSPRVKDVKAELAKHKPEKKTTTRSSSAAAAE